MATVTRTRLIRVTKAAYQAAMVLALKEGTTMGEAASKMLVAIFEQGTLASPPADQLVIPVAQLAQNANQEEPSAFGEYKCKVCQKTLIIGINGNQAENHYKVTGHKQFRPVHIH